MPGYTYTLSQTDNGIFLFNSITSQLGGAALGITGQPNWYTKIATVTSTTKMQVLFESTANVDPVLPLITTPSQVHRILFDADVVSGILTELRLYWGTPIQMPDLTHVDVGTPFIKLWDINTYPRPNKYRYTYRITITNRGFGLVLNPDNVFNAVQTNTTAFILQRPVNPQTGVVRTTNSDGTPDGTLPIFVMFANADTGGTPQINMSVVREIDVNASSPIRSLASPSYFNLYKSSMGWNHPNILSNLTHVIKVPFGLATDRHMYMEEMDICAFVHAGSFINGQAVNIDTYTGSQYSGTRTYMGGFGHVKYGYQTFDSNGNTINTDEILSGARVMLLTQSPGPGPSGSGTPTDITDGNAGTTTTPTPTPTPTAT